MRRARMKPYEAAARGIARTFQNVALFDRLTTLDNICATGHSLEMKRNLNRSSTARIGPALDEVEHRRVCEEIINFLEIEHIRKTPVGAPPAAYKPWNSAGRSRWSRSSCCSMSRWRA